MKIKNAKNIKIKIIIIFLAICLIGLGVYWAKSTLNRLNNENIATIQQMGQQNADNIGQYINDFYNEIKSTESLVNEVKNNNKTEINKILELTCRRSDFIAMAIGEDIASEHFFNSNNDIGSLLSNRDDILNNIKTSDNNIFISASEFNKEFGENINFVAHKFEYNSNNTTKQFTTVGILSSTNLEQQFFHSFFENKGLGILCNSNGDVLVKEKKLGKNIPNKIDISNNDFMTFTDLNNENQIAVFNKIESEPNYIAVSIVPKNIILSNAINKFNKQIFVLALIGFIILLIVLWAVLIKCKCDKKLLDIAFKDELTGFPNKQKFKKDLVEILRHNRLQKYAVILLDIDNFKTFNDIFGFEEGDSVLRYIANTINDELGEEEIFARNSSDNFYILFKYDSKAQIKARLRKIMNKISDYECPKSINYKIICYCGVYKIHPKNYERNADFFIDRARVALMRIIKNHKNGYAFYNDVFRNNIVFETELENDMEQALKDEDFQVYIQPKYYIKTEKIAGGEALIRWQHKTKGFLTPDKFIDLFEKNHFITKLDFYVLEKICKCQKKWLDLGYNVVPISVNQSRLNLFLEDYTNIIKNVINKYNVPPSLIELELTENITYGDYSNIISIIEEFHKSGIKISMDDFGSGYSSLNLLRSIDVDTIKLDREFFGDGVETNKGKIIIQSILQMSKSLNMQSVAEGVETKEHLDFLKTNDCDIAQGFYYSKPITINEFEELIKSK